MRLQEQKRSESWRGKIGPILQELFAAEDRDMRNSHDVQFATRQLNKPGVSLLPGCEDIWVPIQQEPSSNISCLGGSITARLTYDVTA